MVFGRSQDSQRYWRFTLKKRLCESFSCNAGLSPDELQESFDLKVPSLVVFFAPKHLKLPLRHCVVVVDQGAFVRLGSRPSFKDELKPLSLLFYRLTQVTIGLRVSWIFVYVLIAAQHIYIYIYQIS